MNPHSRIDRDVVAVLEQSAAVAAMVRIARPIRSALVSSWWRSFSDRVRGAIAPRLGVVVMTAVMTHVALTGLAAPRGAYWLMLPVLFAIVAAVLWISGTAHSQPRA